MKLLGMLTAASTLSQWIDVAFLLLVATAACAVCSAFVCRVRLLTLRTHDPIVWSMNVAGAILFGWIVLEVIAARVDGLALAALVFGASWIRLSYSTWREAPPAHVTRRTRSAP